MAAIRTLTFAATAGGITPREPQYGGTLGDHGATAVVFTLDAALRPAGARFRVEAVTADGQYDTAPTTDADGQGRVTVTLPPFWTAAAGLLELRVAVTRTDSEGREELLAHTAPARLMIAPRGQGMGGGSEGAVRRGLSDLIDDTRAAITAMQTATDEAIDEMASATADMEATVQTATGDMETTVQTATGEMEATVQAATGEMETTVQAALAALVPLTTAEINQICWGV